jgi:hypothetical protein
MITSTQVSHEVEVAAAQILDVAVEVRLSQSQPFERFLARREAARAAVAKKSQPAAVETSDVVRLFLVARAIARS